MRNWRAPSARRGATTPKTVLLLIAAGVALLALREALRDDPTPAAYLMSAVVAGTDTAPSSASTIATSLGVKQLRLADDAIAPIVPPGVPGILMVSSVTCGWCKRALADLGDFAAGRPLPRLTVLTLEGAAEGGPMLAREGITGARLAGPARSNDQVLLTFRYPGTPTFVAVDRNGRVVRSMPGYPNRDEMRRWYGVMVGDAAVP